MHRHSLLGLLMLAALPTACMVTRSSPSMHIPASPTAGRTAPVPAFSHIFIIAMENKEYGAIIGNANAPYINSLAGRYGLGTQYYAITHPSLPNYLALTGGSSFGIKTDCTPSQSGCSIPGTDTNIADQIEASGRSWRAYMESMPGPCSLADTALYAQRHNPFIYYDDIRTNPSRCGSHVVPYSQFSADLSGGSPSDYVWISPNLCNDMHDCGVSRGDAWLAQNLPPILASQAFQNNGLLFLVWDEGSGSDGCCSVASGGRVALLVISPLANGGYRSTTPETHYSLLRTVEDGWGLAILNRAVEAASMDEYFR